MQKNHPRFYEDCKHFTILNLCNHTSGIRHYNNSNEYLSSDHYDSLVKVLINFADEELLFTPGQKYYYSSYGYIMLGLIIEAVSNVKYAGLFTSFTCGLVAVCRRFTDDFSNFMTT